MKLFKLHKPALIFSVYREGNTVPENHHNHTQVLKALDEKGIKHVELAGRFNNRFERSILVSDDHYELVASIALAHQQVCILYLDETRKAYLIDCLSNERVYRGQWQETGNVLPNEDYTFDPRTDRDYVVR